MRAVSAFAPILLAIAAVSFGVSSPLAAATFEQGECPRTHDPVPALKDARCGWLSVPDNRSKPGSRSIRLPVVMLPAIDKKANDPIVYLEGGPGGPVVPSAQVMVEARINRNRDVIRGQAPSQQQLLVIPGIGHYVLPKSACAQKVRNAFLDNPEAKPDVSCVAALKAPAFAIAPK